MSGQVHREKQEHAPEDNAYVEHIDLKKNEQSQKVSQETEDILDEIDEVLEENAQAFVEAFVQKGGQ